ncbi:MAG TPA: hypothetical protein ENN20_04235 [Candidatus Marinimicrobia bacterium]|nr:hypothetical protein [Candidatus Neomarinimicrobiota bacterium]
MFRLILYLLILYIIWKLVEPYFKKVFDSKSEVRGNQDQKMMDINPDDIEDADFKEIDDSKS